MNLNQKIQDKIKSADEKLNAVQGYKANSISTYINKLLTQGEVEVGYRSQCGATHSTQKVFQEFVKTITLLKKEGFNISEESVKHKNGYATINGGFWNSSIYKL